MASLAAPRIGVVRLPPSIETFVLAAVAALSSTILLKVATVQVLELLEFVLLLYIGFQFVRAGLILTLSKPLFRLAADYGIFCGFALLSGVAAFTRPVYLAEYGVYRLGALTLARVVELILGASATILLTEVFRRSPAKCLFTMKLYFWFGTFSCFLAVTEFPLIRIFKYAQTFTNNARASGFYNEGGPFGLYVVSVMLTGWLLVQRSNGRVRRRYIGGICCGVLALVLSASKAAAVALVLLLAIQAFISSGVRQRAITIGAVLMVVLAIVSLTNVSAGIQGYLQAGRNFETLSHLHERDPNFAYGRVAGVFFVPRMVARHPWLGVGWGNYGLVRNAPEYRGNAAAATFYDQTGLGILALSAEVGIPMTLFLIYLTFKPAILCRRLTHWKPVLNLALVQPVVHLCGAQMNVTYPWVVSAFAMGIAGIVMPVPQTKSGETLTAGSPLLSGRARTHHTV